MLQVQYNNTLMSLSGHIIKKSQQEHKTDKLKSNVKKFSFSFQFMQTEQTHLYTPIELFVLVVELNGWAALMHKYTDTCFVCVSICISFIHKYVWILFVVFLMTINSKRVYIVCKQNTSLHINKQMYVHYPAVLKACTNLVILLEI